MDDVFILQKHKWKIYFNVLDNKGIFLEQALKVLSVANMLPFIKNYWKEIEILSPEDMM